MKTTLITLMFLTASCGDVEAYKADVSNSAAVQPATFDVSAYATVIDSEIAGPSLNVADVSNWGNGQHRVVLREPVPGNSGVFVTVNGNRTLIANAILWNQTDIDVTVWRLDCTEVPCVPRPSGFPRFTLMVVSMSSR
jgi:hypothetical protein